MRESESAPITPNNASDRWSLNARWTLIPTSPGDANTVPAIDMRQARADALEHRDHMRKEIDHRGKLWADLALASDKGAQEFALSSIRTASLLNGGGILAIPAVVALFELDRRALQGSMILTGIIFGAGLLSAALANAIGFHALAVRADQSGLRFFATMQSVSVAYYPADPNAQTWQNSASEYDIKSAKLYRKFHRRRVAAILFLWLSYLLFLSAAGFGGWPLYKSIPH